MNDMATALSAAVSGKELMAHCVEFAKRVKLSGTPEELESFHYLKKCLDGYGYRTKLILHDAYISLPRASSVEADRRTLKSITHSFSLNSPKGGLTADLVDVGEGTMADFAKLDCMSIFTRCASRRSGAAPPPRCCRRCRRRSPAPSPTPMALRCALS
jgi:hypothetical protein